MSLSLLWVTLLDLADSILSCTLAKKLESTMFIVSVIKTCAYPLPLLLTLHLFAPTLTAVKKTGRNYTFVFVKKYRFFGGICEVLI
jgi:hypothetical protein